jgi:pyruvate formate-lyase activating enzyme-like uncharacterized protein
MKTSVDVALEAPVIPHLEKDMASLITWADQQGIQWVNLNELEFSERNVDAFTTRGYQVRNEISAAVKGSQETAKRIVRMIQRKDLDIGVHYCSVSFKDGIQLRNRILRRAKHVAKPYDVITKEGTLLKGAVYPSYTSVRSLYSLLQKTYSIPSHLLYLDVDKKRVEIAVWLLEKVAQQLANEGYRCYIVEEYPTADRLEVERHPLPAL